MTDMKIIDRARKLRAHAQSAEAMGNTAEATAYATKVQALCEEFAIAQDELEGSEVEFGMLAAHTHGGYRMRDSLAQWETWLAWAVAQSCGTVPLMSMASNAMWFAGPKVEREAAARAYLTLHAHAELHSRKAQAARRAELHATAGHGNTGTYRESWLDAFAAALYERLTAAPDTGHAKGRALVVARYDRVREWVNRTVPTGTNSSVAAFKYYQLDKRGLQDGTVAGQQAKVTP